eukprot:TRINITY_DN13465_c0_g1_i1.p2 TRINITY_DN13465_c0_g1~~TRINITY_DN13465_c0_g1_i1.p2  ORF type:complete len:132 (-),score=10.01 TRINITY_DN13465_c0_g1_i1:50-445(-)
MNAMSLSRADRPALIGPLKKGASFCFFRFSSFFFFGVVVSPFFVCGFLFKKKESFPAASPVISVESIKISLRTVRETTRFLFFSSLFLLAAKNNTPVCCFAALNNNKKKKRKHTQQKVKERNATQRQQQRR